VAPLILQQLSAETVLKLRKSNVLWKQQLDATYQTHPSQETLPASNIKTTFNLLDQIDEFMEDLESHTGNPLVGRHLQFHPDNQQNKPEFFARAVQFMERFGQHVHFFKPTIQDPS